MRLFPGDFIVGGWKPEVCPLEHTFPRYLALIRQHEIGENLVRALAVPRAHSVAGCFRSVASACLACTINRLGAGPT